MIPARDEESSIGGVLAGLCDPLDPTTPPDRIIVVDDDSSDRTAALAAAHDGVEVVPAPPLPESWTGKSWACHSGLQQVPQRSAEHGGPDDVVVFLDADVRLTRAALARVVAERDEHGGLVSVQPWHETERPYEQLSCLFNVLAVMGTAMGSRGGATGAFGPVLVTSRTDYEAVGGHGSVRSEVVEDLALAQRYRDAGLPVEVVEGRPRHPVPHVPGRRCDSSRRAGPRTSPSGAGSTRLPRLAAIVWWITCLGSAAFALDDSLRGDLPLVTGVALYLAFVTQLVGDVPPGRPLRAGDGTAVPGAVGVLHRRVRAVPLADPRASLVTWRGRAVSTLVDRR